MHINAISTRKVNPPQDDVYKILDAVDFEFHEKEIFVITSKIVSIHQGRTILNDGTVSRDELMRREAEKIFVQRKYDEGVATVTLKNNTIVSGAGIDESNGDGYFILLPENVQEFCKELHAYLCKRFHVKQCGVVVTDSHSTPLRYGAIGVGIGFYGFIPLKHYQGFPDIFGRKFKYERSNLVDGVAAAAVLAMGEGDEQTPCAVVSDLKGIDFVTGDFYDHWVIPRDEDLYYPLFEKNSKD
jgi:F420-0:gamma-glutamyl ligase